MAEAMAAIVAATAVASSVPAAEAVAADAAAEGGSSDRRDRRCMPPLRRPRCRQKTRCYRVLSDKGRSNTRKMTDAEITRRYRPIPAVRYMRFAVLHSCNTIYTILSSFCHIYLHRFLFTMRIKYVYVFSHISSCPTRHAVIRQFITKFWPKNNLNF